MARRRPFSHRAAAWLAGALVLALAAGPREASAEELVTDLSEHLVAIESNFTGTQILLFGAVETDAPEIRALQRDVVVVVRGPLIDTTVRRKARVAGIWMNYAAQTYRNVPGYYAVVSTRPLDAVASREVLERHQIGFDYLNFETVDDTPPAIGTPAAFREAIVRLMRQGQLYSQVDGGVAFLGDTLFRATVDIPANVPVGNYTAEVYLIRDGNVVHAQASPLYVNKTGFERYVFNLAHRQPLTYGIVAVALALFAGWLAAAVFRNR